MSLFNKKIIFRGIFTLAIASFMSFQLSCDRMTTGPTEKITFAVSVQPISAPVYVAFANGYFKQEKLDVSLRSFTVGKEAFESVMRGEAQFCTVADTPLMFAGLQGEPYFILATIADSNKYMKIVARKDRGVRNPQDLIGKRIGVSMGTTSEYFLDAFLTYNRIPRDRVHIVPLMPEKMAGAFSRDQIDAAVSWNPHFTKQREVLGPQAITFQNESIYKIYWNIVSAQDYVKKHPETVKRVLRALLKADDYILDHREAAHEITLRFVQKDALAMNDYNFDLLLGQALLIELENQARWAVRNRLTEKREIPNFLGYFYADAMEAVDPRSVSVIHK